MHQYCRKPQRQLKLRYKVENIKYIYTCTRIKHNKYLSHFYIVSSPHFTHIILEEMKVKLKSRLRCSHSSVILDIMHTHLCNVMYSLHTSTNCLHVFFLCFFKKACYNGRYLLFTFVLKQRRVIAIP